MPSALFFVDILGFSHSASLPGAEPACDALSDIARLLSSDLARYVQTGTPWKGRYGLSDSIFLVADAVEPAAKAIAEFFFNLAFYNSRTDGLVLMRGGLVLGEVHVVAPLFRETASANLVGEAVVQAVLLERSGPKGPRVLLSEAVADALNDTQTSWIVDRTSVGPAELLWLLPPDLSSVDGQMIGDVARAAVGFLTRNASDPQVLPHAVAYLDLVSRSLIRLKQHHPQAAKTVLQRVDLDSVHPLLRSIADQEPAPSHQLLEHWEQLKKGVSA